MPRKRKDFQQEWLEEATWTIWTLADDYHGWSLHQLAQEAELAPTTVYRLRSQITRDCRVSTLRKLAKAVGLRLEWIGTTPQVVRHLNRKRRAA